MKMKSFLAILFFIISYQFTTAQSSMGFRVEPIVYSANYEKIYSPMIMNTDEFSATKVAIGIGLSYTNNVTESISLSFKPTYIFGELFCGINLGLIASYDISEKVYLLGGTNLLFSGIGSTASGRFISAEKNTIPFIAFGAGYKVSPNVPFEIQFNIPLNDNSYGNVWQYEASVNNSVTSTKFYNVQWMIKLSVGMDFHQF